MDGFERATVEGRRSPGDTVLRCLANSPGPCSRCRQRTATIVLMQDGQPVEVCAPCERSTRGDRAASATIRALERRHVRHGGDTPVMPPLSLHATNYAS